MTIRQSSVGRDILIGMGAGLLAVLPSVRSILFFLGSSRRSKGGGKWRSGRVPLTTSRRIRSRRGSSFFLLCDGALAPLFRMSPPLRRIPWQLNAKELLNHVAWSAAAELTHRAADQRQRRRQARVSALKRGQA